MRLADGISRAVSEAERRQQVEDLKSVLEERIDEMARVQVRLKGPSCDILLGGPPSGVVEAVPADTAQVQGAD